MYNLSSATSNAAKMLLGLENAEKLEFHDTDTDILADFLSRMFARK